MFRREPFKTKAKLPHKNGAMKYSISTNYIIPYFRVCLSVEMLKRCKYSVYRPLPHEQYFPDKPTGNGQKSTALIRAKRAAVGQRETKQR